LLETLELRVRLETLAHKETRVLQEQLAILVLMEQQGRKEAKAEVDGYLVQQLLPLLHSSTLDLTQLPYPALPKYGLIKHLLMPLRLGRIYYLFLLALPSQ
jgi:hypothetical protein